MARRSLMKICHQRLLENIEGVSGGSIMKNDLIIRKNSSNIKSEVKQRNVQRKKKAGPEFRRSRKLSSAFKLVKKPYNVPRYNLSVSKETHFTPHWSSQKGIQMCKSVESLPDLTGSNPIFGASNKKSKPKVYFEERYAVAHYHTRGGPKITEKGPYKPPKFCRSSSENSGNRQEESKLKAVTSTIQEWALKHKRAQPDDFKKIATNPTNDTRPYRSLNEFIQRERDQGRQVGKMGLSSKVLLQEDGMQYCANQNQPPYQQQAASIGPSFQQPQQLPGAHQPGQQLPGYNPQNQTLPGHQKSGVPKPGRGKSTPQRPQQPPPRKQDKPHPQPTPHHQQQQQQYQQDGYYSQWYGSQDGCCCHHQQSCQDCSHYNQQHHPYYQTQPHQQHHHQQHPNYQHHQTQQNQHTQHQFPNPPHNQHPRGPPGQHRGYHKHSVKVDNQHNVPSQVKSYPSTSKLKNSEVNNPSASSEISRFRKHKEKSFIKKNKLSPNTDNAVKENKPEQEPSKQPNSRPLRFTPVYKYRLKHSATKGIVSHLKSRNQKISEYESDSLAWSPIEPEVPLFLSYTNSPNLNSNIKGSIPSKTADGNGKNQNIMSNKEEEVQLGDQMIQNANSISMEPCSFSKNIISKAKYFKDRVVENVTDKLEDQTRVHFAKSSTKKPMGTIRPMSPRPYYSEIGEKDIPIEDLANMSVF